MKKIVDYKKLLGVTYTTSLSELKTIYRNFMKDHHPDKFHDNEELRQEAEKKSKTIIEAYHFLVSISPETHANNAEAYAATINTAGIADFEYKSQTLIITFSDGNNYEYFDVPPTIYHKLVNAPAQARFARRHICNEFVYRKAAKQAVDA
jgi:curved DNA-binding protein CbpA